ncbi:MAG: hypothetical protein LH475_03775 [Cryobacterium sp.]|uniref:hypothetical protein n=1 Tax=Cryobacterium sp. TaxID=1926290 RepID=UPI00229B8C96|nr:hypothetical protein [Cryobacterium sp.]MCY7403739.1 hypothetical protein [Cryobacterium sp.]
MENLAFQLREAAEQDDGLHAALEQEFSDLIGTGLDASNVMDALWWAMHPLQPTPACRIDPAVHLVELQAAVFSRAATFEPQLERMEAGSTVRATASEHRLRRLTLSLAARAHAVDQVLAHFGPGLARATDDPTPVNDELAAGVSAPPLTDATRDRVTHGAQPAGRARWLTIMLATGIAVGVLGTLSAQTLQHTVTVTFAGGASNLALPPGKTIPASLPDEAAIGAITAIFDQPADPLAGELADLGPAYNTVRAVGLTPRGSYGIYLAQRGSSQYCLVIQHVDLTASSICAGASLIAHEGLNLNAVVLGTLGFDETSPPALLDLTASWLTDGTVMSSSTPHVPPGSAYATP